MEHELRVRPGGHVSTAVLTDSSEWPRTTGAMRQPCGTGPTARQRCGWLSARVLPFMLGEHATVLLPDSGSNSAATSTTQIVRSATDAVGRCHQVRRCSSILGRTITWSAGNRLGELRVKHGERSSKSGRAKTGRSDCVNTQVRPPTLLRRRTPCTPTLAVPAREQRHCPENMSSSDEEDALAEGCGLLGVGAAAEERVLSPGQVTTQNCHACSGPVPTHHAMPCPLRLFSPCLCSCMHDG